MMSEQSGLDLSRVFLDEATPLDPGQTGNQGPGEHGVRTNSGELDLIVHTVEEVLGHILGPRFTDHMQQNWWIDAARRNAGGSDHMVHTQSQPGKYWDGRQIAVPVAPVAQKVVDSRRRRRSLVITNITGTAVTVFLARTSGVGPANYPLAQNASITIVTSAEVWAATPAGVAGVLAYVETWDDD